MYNLKVIHYENGTQVRGYSMPVIEAKQEKKIESSSIDDKKPFVSGFKNSELDHCKIDYEKVEMNKQYHSRDSSISRTKQSIYFLARSNKFDYFFTLTFNPDIVDSFNYDECTKKLSSWLHIMKRKNPDLKYIVVPEKHISGRYHFHGLFANCDNMEFVDSGKRTQKNGIIYNVDKYRLGFSTAILLDNNIERISNYITKYITKNFMESIGKGKKRYWASKNLNKAEVETHLVDDLQGYLETLSGVATYEKCISNLDGQKFYYFELGN